MLKHYYGGRWCRQCILQTMDSFTNGQWTRSPMDNGLVHLWTMDSFTYGQWTRSPMDNGLVHLWTMDSFTYGQWTRSPMDNGLVHQWTMVQIMVQTAWRRQWSRGEWSMDNGKWTTHNIQCTAVQILDLCDAATNSATHPMILCSPIRRGYLPL